MRHADGGSEHVDCGVRRLRASENCARRDWVSYRFAIAIERSSEGLSEVVLIWSNQFGVDVSVLYENVMNYNMRRCQA